MVASFTCAHKLQKGKYWVDLSATYNPRREKRHFKRNIIQVVS